MLNNFKSDTELQLVIDSSFKFFFLGGGGNVILSIKHQKTVKCLSPDVLFSSLNLKTSKKNHIWEARTKQYFFFFFFTPAPKDTPIS